MVKFFLNGSFLCFTLLSNLVKKVTLQKKKNISRTKTYRQAVKSTGKLI